MLEPLVIWDLEDDPDGNVLHILEHGVTLEEVEQVVQDPNNDTVPSSSSARPATFGWTTTGKFIIVVWEHVDDDPWTIKPVTAYETNPPRRNRK